MDEQTKLTAKLPYRVLSDSTDKAIDIKAAEGKMLSTESLSDQDKVLLAAIIAYKLQLPNTKLIPADDLLLSVGMLQTGEPS